MEPLSSLPRRYNILWIAPHVHTQRTGPYSEDAGGNGLRINAFNHEDVDVAIDPLSTNRRFPGTDDLAVLGFSEAPPGRVSML